MAGPRSNSSALFDTRGEFARDIPVELIVDWLQRDQTAQAAHEILAPYRVTGSVVVSDSAGLTRMTYEREPLEVMALINEPKELLHHFGVAIGGQAMGVWVADNTEMFYPDTVDCGTIACMLLAVQDRIRAECEVQVGIAATFDTYFRIGNALYGAAADAVESLGEDRTGPGEIVVTRPFWERVAPEGSAGLQACERSRLSCAFGDGLRLLGGNRLPWPEPVEGRYPMPFSSDFYELLCTAKTRQVDAETLRNTVATRFARNATVVLVEREPTQAETVEATVLQQMTRAAIAGAEGARLLSSTSGIEVKTAGSLSIYVFESPSEAWAFAASLRTALEANGIATRTGIATGLVLVFDLEQGGREISGSPVNLASKVAQDCGEFGKMYALEPMPGSTPESFHVAGLNIPVWIA